MLKASRSQCLLASSATAPELLQLRCTRWIWLHALILHLNCVKEAFSAVGRSLTKCFLFMFVSDKKKTVAFACSRAP